VVTVGLVRIRSIFHTADDPSLERLPFFEQLLCAFRIHVLRMEMPRRSPDPTPARVPRPFGSSETVSTLWLFLRTAAVERTVFFLRETLCFAGLLFAALLFAAVFFPAASLSFRVNFMEALGLCSFCFFLRFVFFLLITAVYLTTHP